MTVSREDGYRTSVECEIGSMQDLARIAALETPRGVTTEEAVTFLEAEHIPESFARAIIATAPPQEGGWWGGMSAFSEGDTNWPFPTKSTVYELGVQILPYGLPPDEHGQYRDGEYRPLTISVQRDTPAGMFNFAYCLRFPLKRGSNQLERSMTAKGPMSPSATVDYPDAAYAKQSKTPRDVSPEQLLQVVREAASDLRIAIMGRDLSQNMTSAAGSLATEKTIQE